LTFRSASIAAVAVVVVGLMWVGHGLSLGVPGQGAGAPSGADSGSAALAVMGPADGEPLRFGRDVRPILSDRCFLCHGPDRAKQQAGLRLDSFEAATAARPHGAAIVPGDPAASLAVRRLLTRDPDAVMPPPDSGKHALSQAERATLVRWIREGARYEPHWAFEAPCAVTPPELRASRGGGSAVPAAPVEAEAPGSPIDRFVHARLAAAGVAPGPEADRATLCRRVFIDLTGLPPTPEELGAFLKDAAPDAFARLVDRLLGEEPYATRYAERMATPWLDVARYADTSGIHMDAGRQMWAWRDWVIEAFRSNMPYDRFVVEQVAGDLIPGATVSQRVASGFNRAHVTSDEGGAINEEYLLEYAADRTHTVGAAFLGLTMNCARCHDHKFDPVTQEDFYSLLAFFNSNEEPGIYSQVSDANRAFEPSIDVPTPAHAERTGVLRAAAESARAERDRVDDSEREAFEAFAASLRGGIAWVPSTVVRATSEGGATLVPQADGSVLASGTNPDHDVHELVLRTDGTGMRAVLLEALADPSLAGGRVGRADNGNAVLDAIEVEAVSVAEPSRRERVTLAWAWADVEQSNGDFRVTNALAADGRVWAVDAHVRPGGRTALFVSSAPFGFDGGTELRVRLVTRSPYARHVFGRVRVRPGTVPDALLARMPPATGNWYICGPFPASGGAEAYAARYGPETRTRLDVAERFGSRATGEFEWRYAPGVLEATPVRLAEGVDAEFVAREAWVPVAGSMELSLGSDDGLQVFVNGAMVHERRIDRAVAPDQERVTVPLQAGANAIVCKVVNTGGQGGFYHRELDRPGDVARDALVLAMPAGTVGPAAEAAARDAWRAHHSEGYKQRAARAAEADAALAAHVAAAPRTMVMQERMEPTPTFVLRRGLYDQADRERPVARAVPRAIGTLPPDAPRNRLGLAQWLVGDANPLTARVVVNRFWEQFFGRGIVRSTEDFGLQGDWPTHPELLDWLAVDFRTHGWDVDRLVRQIVTSATYRQSSRVRPDVAAWDAENRLLAWYPRQRLAAEQIRDQALFVAGLLRERAGGPSVKPYQPAGLWEETSMPQSNTRSYAQGTGDDLWRRSLYTYWKRASPPPSMLALDAPTREFCTTRRFTTNTPLQALVLWNDPQFVEAARVAAERTLREAGDDRARLGRLWTRMTGEPADDVQVEVLAEALASERARWGADAESAARLVRTGEAPVPQDVPATELASWTMLSNAILASDAAIVKD
jgi:hypothetical protein